MAEGTRSHGQAYRTPDSPVLLPPTEVADAPFASESDATRAIERLPPIAGELGFEDLPPQAFAQGSLAEEPTSADATEAPAKAGPTDRRSPFGIRGFWAPSTDVDGQSAELGMNSQEVNFMLPLLITKESGMWLATGNFKRLEFSTAAYLTGTAMPVPSQLWSLQLGTMHTRQLDNGWNVGGMFMFGSLSDQPFAALRDMTFTVMSFVNVPARNERDAWNFSLFYSPTSQLPYPLPGVAYVWKPSPQIEAKIGLPAALVYRPTEDITFSLTYTPLTNFNLRAERRLAENWALYTGYQIYNDTYFLADRVEDDQRFYVFDQRVLAGLERRLGQHFVLDFAAAYLFDRQLFQAVNFSDDREDIVKFDPGFGLMAQLTWSR